MKKRMGNPLYQYLKRRRVSQADLARRGGWRPATVSGWCNRVVPSISHALEIERATGGEVTVAQWAAYAAEIGEKAPASGEAA